MKKLILLLSFIGILITSCDNKQKEEKISQIDSLLTEINAFSSYLSSLNIDSLNNIKINMDSVMLVFKQAAPDIQNNDEIKLFDHSATIRRQISKFLAGYKLIQKEVNFTEHQLTDLKHDVEYDLINDSLYNVYLSSEKEIIKKLKVDYYAKEEMVNNKLELHKLINDELTEIVIKYNPDTTEIVNSK